MSAPAPNPNPGGTGPSGTTGSSAAGSAPTSPGPPATWPGGTGGPPAEPIDWTVLFLKGVVAFLALAVFLPAFAATTVRWHHDPEMARNLLLFSLCGLFGCLAALFAVRLAECLERGETLGLESHWGGLGSGMGGWKISRATGYLLCTVSFGAMLAVAASSVKTATAPVDPAEAKQEEDSGANAKPGDTKSGEGEQKSPSNAATAGDTDAGKDAATQNQDSTGEKKQ